MIGKTVSHYKIIEKLGGGGMGIVYKAEDTRLKRPVALKFLPPAFASDPISKERFIYEAQFASALQHSNICTVHEINESDDGQMYIVMDYYEGETLKMKLEKANLNVEEAIGYVIQIANGLQKAHDKGIIHRDIKPANIIVTKDGEVKILDFGLSKFKGQSKLTKTGSMIGTVAYMSPEQASGNVIDHRTDIWSLGVILYEMITGELPFKGEYDQAMVYSILNEKPGSMEKIPIELKNIIESTLAKDPGRRYQEIKILSDNLAEIRAKLKKAQTQSSKSRKNYKSIIIPSTMIFIIVIISALIYFLNNNPILKGEKTSEWENSIAVLPFANINNDPDQEYFCDGMTEQIITNLAKLPKLKVVSRTSVMRYKNTKKSIPEISSELNVAYVLEGSVRSFGNRIRITAQLINTQDDFHLWAENYDKEMTQLFDVQDDVSNSIARNLLGKLSREENSAIKTKRTVNTEAYEYYLKGNYFHGEEVGFGEPDRLNKVRENLSKSEQMYKKAIELDPNFADSYAALANVYNSRYNWFEMSNEEKNINLNLQEAYLDKAFKLDSLSAEAYYVKFYMFDINVKKFFNAKAYEQFENALYEQFLCLKKAIKINHNHSDTYHALGWFYQLRGLDYLALKCWIRSLELSPLEYYRYSFRGDQYFKTGQYSDAESDYLKVLDFDPDDFYTLRELSRLLIASKRYDEAEKILARINKTFPDRNIDLLYALIDASRGEKKQALDKYTGRNVYLFSLLDMKNEAIEELSNWSIEQLKIKSSQYYILKNHPFYEHIRSDPRFQEILSKHKKLYEENLAKYGDINMP